MFHIYETLINIFENNVSYFDDYIIFNFLINSVTDIVIRDEVTKYINKI